MRAVHIVLVPVLVIGLFAGAGMAQPDTSTNPSAQTGQPGPPDGLPEPVPDFVEDILGSIQAFVDGVLDGDLGETVSDIATKGSPGEN